MQTLQQLTHNVHGKAVQTLHQLRPSALVLLSSSKHEAQHANMRCSVCRSSAVRQQEAAGRGPSDFMRPLVLLSTCVSAQQQTGSATAQHQAHIALQQQRCDSISRATTLL